MAQVIDQGDGTFKNERGHWVCGRKRRRCNDCNRKYPKEEYDLWECPECGADRHCGFVVTYGGEACRNHGGNSARGAEHWNYKHGAYSKYLPANLAQDYEDYMNDPERMGLEREMALVRAMIADRARALNAVNSAEAWERLARIYKRMEIASQKQQAETHARLFVEMGKVLEEGVGLSGTRKELKGLIDQERKLMDTERQLMVDMGELITRGMVLMMFNNYMEAVKSHVLPLEGGAKAVTEIAGAIRSMVGQLGGGQSRKRSPAIIDSGTRVAER